MSAVKTIWTDEELMQVDHEGKVELVNGELILMTPAGMEQGEVDVNIIVLLATYVKKKKSGKVYDAQTCFRPHDNMRAPDVSFVSEVVSTCVVGAAVVCTIGFTAHRLVVLFQTHLLAAPHRSALRQDMHFTPHAYVGGETFVSAVGSQK